MRAVKRHRAGHVGVILVASLVGMIEGSRAGCLGSEPRCLSLRSKGAVAMAPGVCQTILAVCRLRGGSDTPPEVFRFKVGDRVAARTADGWRPGTVVQVKYREPDWPEEQFAPYQIELDQVIEQGGQRGRPLIYAQIDSEQLVRATPDLLTLEDLALHLAGARAKYRNASDVPDEAVCRYILTTRMDNLPLSRVRVEPSSISGAGDGLFATRDIAEGELITLYPADAALVWDDKDRSEESNVRVFFGRHVPAEKRDAAGVLSGWSEVPCHDSMSILADPRDCYDAAYMGHVANDASSCTAPEGRNVYERESAARSNAEIVPLDVEETDEEGHPQVLHFALRANKAIKKSEEVLLSYGYGYWEKQMASAGA